MAKVEREATFATFMGLKSNIRLIPGTNELSDEQLKDLQADPLFKASVIRGENVIILDDESEEAAPKKSAARRKV